MKNILIIIVTTLVLGGVCNPSYSADESGLGHDYRTFYADGKIEYGKIGDSYKADLVMYLAGNQFMVMEDLIKDFQSKNGDIKTVYVETIPPGQILKKQLLEQGMINKEKTSMNPDLYASVNINHLKKLNSKKLMDKYIIYIHNKLELMVAKGNPKGIKSPKDLGRDDIIQSHPNPLTEGIFKFYGIAMLKQLGLYEKVTADAKCKNCWAVAGKTWFTTRHHRETPHMIEKGEADTGIVWATEVAYAKRQGRALEGVVISPELNQQEKVAYAIGPMIKARNMKNALRFLDYLASKAAQDIYVGYGFGSATSDELKIKSLNKK